MARQNKLYTKDVVCGKNVKLGSAKFSQDQVRALREAYEHPERPAYMTYRYLAKLHNVSNTCMDRILSYKTYKEY